MSRYLALFEWNPDYAEGNYAVVWSDLWRIILGQVLAVEILLVAALADRSNGMRAR